MPVGTDVSVTLLRPLANARTIRFPSMARTALEGVLARDWTRHVIGLRAVPHTVAVRQIDRGLWRASFTPTYTLEAIAELGATFQWRDVIIQTSDDALAVACRALDSTAAKEAIVVVCDDNGPIDAVHLVAGEPVLGRRFPAGATDEETLAFVRHSATAPVVVTGSPPRAAALARTFGRNARTLDIGVEAGTPAEAIIGIAGTFGRPALQFLSSSSRSARTQEMRRLARWLWSASAAALVIAFAIERWGTSAALADVQRQRADISAQVSNAMVVRGRLDDETEAAAALGEREAAASRASGVIAAVAVALPPGTALTTLNVAGDSVTIEGESMRSAAVYEALRGVPMLEQVRLAAPLRQERQAGDIAVQRFAFNARIRSAPVSTR
jgi:Tfp pilus assembly protein PilN